MTHKLYRIAPDPNWARIATYAPRNQYRTLDRIARRLREHSRKLATKQPKLITR